jgi:hypothetical protein
MVEPQFAVYACFGWNSRENFGVVNTGESAFCFDRRSLHPSVLNNFTYFALQDVTLYVLHYLACRAAAHATDTDCQDFLQSFTKSVSQDLMKLIDMRKPEMPEEHVGSPIKARITLTLCDTMISRLFATLTILVHACSQVERLQHLIFPPLEYILCNSRQFDIRVGALNLLHKIVTATKTPASAQLLERLLSLATDVKVALPAAKVYTPRWSQSRRAKILIPGGRSSTSSQCMEQLSFAADPPTTVVGCALLRCADCAPTEPIAQFRCRCVCG